MKTLSGKLDLIHSRFDQFSKTISLFHPDCQGVSRATDKRVHVGIKTKI